MVKSCFKNVLSLSWLRGRSEPQTGGCTGIPSVPSGFQELPSKVLTAIEWHHPRFIPSHRLLTGLEQEGFFPVDIFSPISPGGYACWVKGEWGEEHVGKVRGNWDGTGMEHEEKTNEKKKWTAKIFVWENRNLRPVFWQVTQMLNENGRIRSEEKWGRREERDGDRRKERWTRAREEEREGSKTSKTQCVTETYQ